MQRWFKRNSLQLTLVLSPLLAASSFAGGDSLTLQTPSSSSASSASTTPQITATQARPSYYQLTPFKAYYQAQFDLGVNISGEAVRELKALPNGQWLLSMQANAMMANIEESSRFEILQQQLRPIEYRYYRKTFTKSKQSKQLFNWSDGTATHTAKGPSTTLLLDNKTHDNVSYQIQLWQDLKAGLSEMRYSLADGDHLKALEFDRIGEERINTPAGSFETLKVVRDRGEHSTRKTTLWFAKNLDHVLVKLHQTETDGKQYTLLLARLETP